MLAKMWGWNEPERVNVQNVEVKVDSALTGNAQPLTRDEHKAFLMPAFDSG